MSNDDLPSVYRVLERNMMRASERLREVGSRGSALPTLYPRGGDDAGDLSWSDRDAYVRGFRALLDRLSEADADRLKKHIALWPASDPRIFDKLRLYVWGKSNLFPGAEAGDHVLALSDDHFWRDDDRRELLFLLRKRWEHFPAPRRRRIGRRLLDGPPRRDAEDGAAYGTRRQSAAATCFGWLVQAGCAFSDDLVAQWETLKGALPGWNGGWVDYAVAAREIQVGQVTLNEDASVLEDVPVADIVRESLDHSGRIDDPFVENEPFTGLVKTRPARAIRALGAAVRRGEFPEHLWSSAIRNWPDNAPPRATRVLHGRMQRLPSGTIVAMGGTVGEWLAERFPALAADDRILAHGVFDHFVESLLAAGSAERERSSGEWAIGVSRVQASRPTFDHAINAPIGKAVEGLLQLLKKDPPEQGAGVPEEFRLRVDRLVDASGEGADEAACVLSSRAAWLRGIDPGWVNTRMIPWFCPDHDRGEPAWNGILLGGPASVGPLFGEIKDGFLALPARMHEWGWREEIELYCELIVELTLLSGSAGSILSFESARQCLRLINPEGRKHVIWLLGRVGAENDEGWRQLVTPFIRKAWPNERRYQTSGTSEMWLTLLCNTNEAFPDVFSAVRNHLGAVDPNQAMLGEMEPLAERFPRRTLDLLNRVVPDVTEEAPYGLSTVLTLLREGEPALIGDARYSRLHQLAARH